MVQPDIHLARAQHPAADALPKDQPYQPPAFDANRRWYDAYLDIVRRANDLVIDMVQQRRQIDTLEQALVLVLDETNGGSFLSTRTRERVQELVQQSRAGIPT